MRACAFTVCANNVRVYICRVCYSSLSQQQSYSGYVRQYYSYYVRCGYNSRCPRYTKTYLQKHSARRPCSIRETCLTLILPDTDTDSNLGLSIGQLTTPNAIVARGTNRATANHAVRRAYRAVQAAAVSYNAWWLVVRTGFISVVAINVLQLYAYFDTHSYLQ